METSSYWRTSFSRRRALRAGFLTSAGIAAAALIGCSSAQHKTAPASGAPSASTPGASAQPQRVVSDALNMIQTRDAASLDPLDSQVYTVPERAGLVYPKLIYKIRDANADMT